MDLEFQHLLGVDISGKSEVKTEKQIILTYLGLELEVKRKRILIQKQKKKKGYKNKTR